MTDEEIVELYWNRLELAITETDIKYGKLCYYIANNILCSESDSEECVNDTYHSVWKVIPPERPQIFRAFLCKITRNTALNRYDYMHAQKRNSEYECSLSELEEMLTYDDKSFDQSFLTHLINDFVGSLSKENRIIFLRRYWFCDSIHDIATKFNSSDSKVKSRLFRIRNQFYDFLKKEGAIV